MVKDCLNLVKETIIILIHDSTIEIRAKKFYRKSSLNDDYLRQNFARTVQESSKQKLQSPLGGKKGLANHCMKY